jgi:hypothetical protein
LAINQTKYELQNILSGKSRQSYDAIIQAISSYLRESKSTSNLVKNQLENKSEEKKRLIKYAEKENLIFKDIDEKDFVSEGAEQKVFIKGLDDVLKLNDAIYYESWEDYFLNLLMHNYFFADTAYQFLGFYKEVDELYAVVKQPFIEADDFTNLHNVKEFLKNNGFENTRNHDYYHPKLGIILEGLHDENVLTKGKYLYFIDTVFYIKPEIFWKT